jgi:pyruvate/2-oxoacid:ferredoxin oxidoreductase alpha subunit
MKKVIMGNHALSHGATLARVQVIAAYPITPQTQVVELLSEIVADNKLKAEFIKVESEHSAMAACIGAASAGARTFTATSAQGLALMHELLHWAAGARLPIVMADINRAMAPPWTIWSDQSDSLSQRDTGWMQFYCQSNQEVLDTVIMAYKVAEKVLMPVMIVLDAFSLSHTYEIVDIPDQALVDKYLPPFDYKYKLDVSDPHAYGGLTQADWFMEFRVKMQEAMEQALVEIKKEAGEFEKIFGRRYDPVEPYLVDDADIVLVTSGTAASTARFAVDQMRQKGKKVGNLRVRNLRPFPFADIREQLKNAKKIAVIDRNISYGYHGIFAQEVKSALYGYSKVPVFNFIAGLGGRDIFPETIMNVVAAVRKMKKPEQDLYWVEVKR